ncbi:MAG: 4Fe-4S binding protein [Elusimicrobia bacterium]|nr:4Fe-4S binding protein [Elusimicrobiota bacterium]
MAIRKIICIDEKRCNGCGLCVTGCPEGAIQIVDGKAKLVGDLLCDGLGACIGNCPQEAITIEERETENYNEKKVMENIIKGGDNLIKAHLKHLKEHSQIKYLAEAENILKEKNIKIPDINSDNMDKPECSCPGSKSVDFRKDTNIKKTGKNNKNISLDSELKNWPVQLQLLNPNAPYLKNANLLITADCVPFSYANFHSKFLKDKVLIIFCPKLDKTLQEYIEKLTEIFKINNIKSITIVHMEVPCCFGISRIIEEALGNSGKKIAVKEYVVSIKGQIIKK